MNYTVEQVANKLNVSKVTIYNKLKLTQFKDKILMKQGQTMIDADLLNLIKESIKFTYKVIEEAKIEPKETKTEDENAQDSVAEDTFDFNKEMFKNFTEQLKVKDMQIAELNIRLSQEQDLHKNTQILFKQQQPQDIKLLEAHFEELDTKIEEVKNKMIDRKEQNEKRSLFSKIFK